MGAGGVLSPPERPLPPRRSPQMAEQVQPGLLCSEAGAPLCHGAGGRLAEGQPLGMVTTAVSLGPGPSPLHSPWCFCPISRPESLPE